ncbi:transposable element Tcb1 transposase [Trichonephila clavipes]|nr:transposable element Tcb1 transposase [Trichonephila clavipes]
MWAAEWNEVVFTDESRICLSLHDGRNHVWGHRGERMLNGCVMHRHTAPAPGHTLKLIDGFVIGPRNSKSCSSDMDNADDGTLI